MSDHVPVIDGPLMVSFQICISYPSPPYKMSDYVPVIDGPWMVSFQICISYPPLHTRCRIMYQWLMVLGWSHFKSVSPIPPIPPLHTRCRIMYQWLMVLGWSHFKSVSPIPPLHTRCRIMYQWLNRISLIQYCHNVEM
jgi:hypothetical protein